jgi:hypothetical protein
LEQRNPFNQLHDNHQAEMPVWLDEESGLFFAGGTLLKFGKISYFEKWR